jgi:transcription elongation factor Elf1
MLERPVALPATTTERAMILQDPSAERPFCPVCNIDMQLVRVLEGKKQELWVHKCGNCGYETGIIIEP